MIIIVEHLGGGLSKSTRGEASISPHHLMGRLYRNNATGTEQVNIKQVTEIDKHVPPEKRTVLNPWQPFEIGPRKVNTLGDADSSRTT